VLVADDDALVVDPDDAAVACEHAIFEGEAGARLLAEHGTPGAVGSPRAGGTPPAPHCSESSGTPRTPRAVGSPRAGSPRSASFMTGQGRFDARAIVGWMRLSQKR